MTTADVLVGGSDEVRSLTADIELAASCDAHVLITGESGVDKAAVARAIHERSARRDASLRRINCATSSQAWLESQLFGDGTTLGRLDAARGGTVFLQHIGRLHERTQDRLARYLDQASRFGARFVATADASLYQRVEEGTFRADLFYRLNTLHLRVPPVRARRVDIPPLLTRFLSQVARKRGRLAPELTEDALSELMAYSWPGNLRELRSTAEALVDGSQSGVITRNELPALNPPVRSERPQRTVHPIKSQADARDWRH
jgi:DNA-binding NtrC family response regulator